LSTDKSLVKLSRSSDQYSSFSVKMLTNKHTNKQVNKQTWLNRSSLAQAIILKQQHRHRADVGWNFWTVWPRKVCNNVSCLSLNSSTMSWLVQLQQFRD